MAVIRPRAAGGRLAAGAPRTLPFCGCLYYAALRPAEAAALRGGDCVLPPQAGPDRPGHLRAPRQNRWTGTGASHEHCGLKKHRAEKEVPADFGAGGARNAR
jgi:hypothetical protein